MWGNRGGWWILWVSVMLSLAGSAWAERVNRLTLLHFNDIYEINPQQDVGGFAPLLTLIEQQRHRYSPSLLTFGGDLLSPSVLSYLTHGKEMISLCNQMGVDVAVVGNHEFDFGLETLQYRLGESRFPWLAANVRGRDGALLPHSREWMIRQMGEVTIAFIGLLTPSTTELATVGDQLTVQDPVAVARQLVPVLRAQGVDLIVALTHLAQAEDAELARQVPGIDLILGGHDHDSMLQMVGTVPIVKAASDGGQLAVVELTLVRPELQERGKPRLITEVHFLSTFRQPPHPVVQSVLDGINQRLSGQLQAVLGTIADELDSRESTVRERESSMGNLFADAMRAESKADLAVLNGGSLRGNRLYAPGSVMTYGDIYKESPFGNTVVLLEMSEQAIWQALEHGLSQLGTGAGRFLHVSGLTLRVDPRRPVGERVLAVQLQQGDSPYAMQRDGKRLWKVASNDYLARGGDGFRMLAESRLLISPEAGKPLSTVVMEYLQQQGTPLLSPPSGRIMGIGSLE